MRIEAALLEVEHISKAFGGIAAVNDVSFAITAGEILGLIGPNGSGKSTVINIISMLEPPSGGEVRFRSKRISNLPSYKVAQLGIARTFQLLRLFQGLSVYDNVLAATYPLGSHGLLGAIVGRSLTGPEEDRMREKTREILEFVGLTARSSVLAQRLTAGEGRLLEIARALAAEPKLILLDEPAAGLNTFETELLEQKLKKLQSQGQSMLLVDHHMRMVMRLASRVVVLNEGRVLAQGTPDEIQRNSRVVEAYLGTGSLQRRRRRI